MAVITATDISGTGETLVTETTLGASDTLTYLAGRRQLLTLTNDTAGALTPNIDGAGASAAYPVAGAAAVDLSAGYTTASIGVGEVASIYLDTIQLYLKGVITITGADGITATLTNV